MRNTWQKPANAKQPIPLQSKNGYLPPGTPSRAPYPPGPRYQETSPEYPGPPPPHMQRSYDGDRVKPIDVDNDRDQVYGRQSPPDQQKPAWAKAPRPYPSHPPSMPKYDQNGHRGSVYEMPDSQEQSSMHPPPSVHRTNSSASQYSQAPHPPSHNNTPPNQNNVQAIAQAASTHSAAIRPSPSRRNEQYTEREKMLKGLYYLPLTPALTEDRERCIAAIWRFNNATNPSHGASPEERCRLFRQIIGLRPTPEPPGPNGEVPTSQMELPFGSVGERVVVEAPFNCDYGYNITVGDDVLIGADCRISDTCSVTIGARCIFSPNVKLVCATYPIDPRRRLGSNGPALGRNIVIEEDCWIGSNVTILAGVRVGKSSTVGAGSLLHQVRHIQQKNIDAKQRLRTDGEKIGCAKIYSSSRQSRQSKPRHLRRERRRSVIISSHYRIRVHTMHSLTHSLPPNPRLCPSPSSFHPKRKRTKNPTRLLFLIQKRNPEPVETPPPSLSLSPLSHFRIRERPLPSTSPSPPLLSLSPFDFHPRPPKKSSQLTNSPFHACPMFLFPPPPTKEKTKSARVCLVFNRTGYDTIRYVRAKNKKAFVGAWNMHAVRLLFF